MEDKGLCPHCGGSNWEHRQGAYLIPQQVGRPRGGKGYEVPDYYVCRDCGREFYALAKTPTEKAAEAAREGRRAETHRAYLANTDAYGNLLDNEDGDAGPIVTGTWEMLDSHGEVCGLAETEDEAKAKVAYAASKGIVRTYRKEED